MQHNAEMSEYQQNLLTVWQEQRTSWQTYWDKQLQRTINPTA